MTEAEKAVKALRAANLTCAVAESCTGGGVGHAITAVSGASEVFAGGVISYSNELKRSLLGVLAETLERFGAVSGEVAREMSTGARATTGADIAVSVTGIAGPGGGSEEKPVGLVWFAVSSVCGVRTDRVVFCGDRDAVRAQAVSHALGMIVEVAKEIAG